MHIWRQHNYVLRYQAYHVCMYTKPIIITEIILFIGIRVVIVICCTEIVCTFH